MTTRAITDALKDRLGTLVFTPAIPIAWQNRDHTPAGDRFLSVVFVRADNDRLGIKGTMTRRYGSLVVTVCTKPNAGTGEGESLADAVAAHFPADLLLADLVRITAQPTVKDAYLDGKFWRTPVVIPYEALSL